MHQFCGETFFQGICFNTVNKKGWCNVNYKNFGFLGGKVNGALYKKTQNKIGKNNKSFQTKKAKLHSLYHNRNHKVHGNGQNNQINNARL